MRTLTCKPALAGASGWPVVLLGLLSGLMTAWPSPARASKELTFPQGGEAAVTALKNVEVIERLGDKVPGGLVFKDAAGQRIELDALLNQGRPILMTLGYHRCPMLCGLVLDGLVKSINETQSQPGRDFLGLSLSIDPEEDPKAMAEAQGKVLKGIKSAATVTPEQWPFVSADAATITQMADAVGFKYQYDPESKLFAHNAVAFVLAPDGTISRYLYGVETSARDFRMALVEAGRGRVGTAFERVVLSCFKYDPIGRKYAPYVMAFVRMAAGLVLLSLVALLAVLWRKEIQMKRRRVA